MIANVLGIGVFEVIVLENAAICKVVSQLSFRSFIYCIRIQILEPQYLFHLINVGQLAPKELLSASCISAFVFFSH